MTIPLYIGHDPREAIAYHAFQESVLSHTKEQVSFSPVTGEQRDGSNRFIYARFLVPYYCDYKGWAIWFDGDGTCLADIKELWDMRDERYAVMCVKHDYKTKYPVKYWNQKNEDYPRKNWSSLVLWNCGHASNYQLNPRYVEIATGSFLHRFSWLRDSEIGELPKEWNHLALEQDYDANAKLVHHTVGLPIDPVADGDPWEGDWLDYRNKATRYGA